MEPIVDKHGLQDLGLLKSSSSPSLMDSPVKLNKTLKQSVMEDQLYRTGEVIKTKSKFPYNQPDQNLGYVPEQRSVAEDDNHSDNVARFLQELDAESPKHFKPPQQPKAKQVAPNMNATKDKELKMAYIEHERATPDQFNGRQTMNGKINQSSTNDLQNMALNFPDKGLIKVQSIQRILDEN